MQTPLPIKEWRVSASKGDWLFFHAVLAMECISMKAFAPVVDLNVPLIFLFDSTTCW